MNSQATLTPELDPRAIAKLFDIKGARVFLPGGYGAIGEALSVAMAHRGAEVVIAGPRVEKAEALAESIRQSGGKAHGFAVDAQRVSSIEDVTVP